MSAGSNNETLWPDVVAREFGLRLHSPATGGAAYTQERKPFTDQAQKIEFDRPNILIVAGSVNDRAADPETLTEAATELLSALKSKYPAAHVVAVGPLGSSASSLNVLAWQTKRLKTLLTLPT